MHQGFSPDGNLVALDVLELLDLVELLNLMDLVDLPVGGGA